MSLIKQLWLTIVALLLLAFAGSLIIGISTSRHYIEQEIRIKNSDNANALALSMSQLEKDPVIVELLVAAQFDTGHYRRIELRAPDGEIIEKRVDSEHIEDVPSWFVDLVSFDVPAGRAVVQDGWRQYATVILESHHSFAYRSLWQSSLALIAWFLLATVISMLLGWWLVTTIRRPLLQVVNQAKAIGERRFIITKEPSTRELREVVRAMNQLSTSVHDMLGKESEKLEHLRRHLQHDPVTGILDRDPFLAQLRQHLDSDGSRANGSLAMVRLAKLTELNATFGRQRTDELLQKVAQRLDRLGKVRSVGSRAGRLNGTDFVLLLPSDSDLEAIGSELHQQLQEIAQEEGELSLMLPSALIHYAQGDHIKELLSSLDAALASAEAKGHFGQTLAKGPDRIQLFTDHAQWRLALEEAMKLGVYLARFPVLDARTHLLHMECPARLRLKGQWRSAGVFMPWLARLGLEPELDLAVVKNALADIQQRNKPVGVNLSPASIRDSRFVMDLRALIASHQEIAEQLWMELPEAMAIHDMESFRSLCRELQPFGCKIGLEHVGAEFTRIADLHDLGLAYLKIDASLTKGVPDNPEQQTILRGMATLCHSIGILAIAEGVDNLKEAETLFELGLDGVTGPGVRQRGLDQPET